MTADSPAVVASFIPQLEQAREDFLSARQEAASQTQAKKQRTFAFLSGADILAMPRTQWRMKGALTAGSVVFLDTLNAATSGLDENSSRDMGEILEAAKTLQRLTGGLVVLVHHSGKDASKGLRGHSSLLAALDAVIEVGRNGDARYWRMSKSKESEDGKRRHHPPRQGQPGAKHAAAGKGGDNDGFVPPWRAQAVPGNGLRSARQAALQAASLLLPRPQRDKPAEHDQQRHGQLKRGH